MNNITFKSVKVRKQLSPTQLTQSTINNHQGLLNNTGVLCINTGQFTGRSPQDKFIVDEESISSNIDWTSDFNHKFSEKHFELLKNDVLDYLDNKEEIWFRKCYASANPKFQIGVNVYNEYPSSNLFSYNMFLRPSDIADEEECIQEWTIIQAPGFEANTAIHGTRSTNFSIISFKHQTILIGGSGYTGEIKKGLFTVLNYLLPQKFKVLSMHCSANIGVNNDVALFFGLSGTGKTTLSTDPLRKLIGDDEHGWDKTSVFNLEGGCYAKIIGLNEKFEPEIYAAIKDGALVENVVLKPDTNSIDFSDSFYTENTRVSYPINFIDNIAKPSVGKIPSTIFFLTCDASGVFPPISKLTISQAKYYFLSGYTSKVAGTETGITEPKSTFSTCFGAPFLPLHPTVYVDLLGEKLQENDIDVWLVNTGWSGEPYGVGQRISIKHTRNLISAALNGSLAKQEFDLFPVFNLMVPKNCLNIPSDILNPALQTGSNAEFMTRLLSLAEKFDSNFSQFKTMMSEDVVSCNPKLV